jgi:hypothetical protein
MTSKRSESSEGGDKRKRKALDLDMKLRGECLLTYSMEQSPFLDFYQ